MAKRKAVLALAIGGLLILGPTLGVAGSPDEGPKLLSPEEEVPTARYLDTDTLHIIKYNNSTGEWRDLGPAPLDIALDNPIIEAQCSGVEDGAFCHDQKHQDTCRWDVARKWEYTGTDADRTAFMYGHCSAVRIKKNGDQSEVQFRPAIQTSRRTTHNPPGILNDFDIDDTWNYTWKIHWTDSSGNRFPNQDTDDTKARQPVNMTTWHSRPGDCGAVEVTDPTTPDNSRLFLSCVWSVSPLENINHHIPDVDTGQSGYQLCKDPPTCFDKATIEGFELVGTVLKNGDSKLSVTLDCQCI